MTDSTSPENNVTPAPPKRGFPWWGWVLVGIGALVIIITVAVVAVRLASASADRVATATTPAPAATGSPQPSTTPRAPETDPGTPAGQSTGNIALDDAFVIGTSMPAIWQIPVIDGWEFTTLDQEGITVLTNEALACTFTTSQNRQIPADPSEMSDRRETEATVQSMQQSFLSQAPAAEITNTPGLAVPYGAAEAETDVEFAGFRADYVRDDTGEPFSSMYVVRAMPQIEGMMSSVLNCPTATIDADETIWSGLLDRTVVIAGD